MRNFVLRNFVSTLCSTKRKVKNLLPRCKWHFFAIVNLAFVYLFWLLIFVILPYVFPDNVTYWARRYYWNSGNCFYRSLQYITVSWKPLPWSPWNCKKRFRGLIQGSRGLFDENNCRFQMFVTLSLTLETKIIEIIYLSRELIEYNSRQPRRRAFWHDRCATTYIIINEAKKCVALPRAWRHSVRALSLWYHFKTDQKLYGWMRSILLSWTNVIWTQQPVISQKHPQKSGGSTIKQRCP
jgi:hypothetical protein